MRRGCRVALIVLAVGAVGLGLGAAANDYAVGSAARGRLMQDPALVPATDVALVLGTNPRARGGRENLFFRY